MSYIGNEPIVSATRTITEISATSGQTVFVANGGYTVGKIDVFVNGAQLQTTDYTATNGSSVTLNSACAAGDDVRLVAWGTFSTANITSGSLTPGAPTWSPTGGVSLPRIDSSTEGGQLNFNRASDDVGNWAIDSYGSGSTPSLRFIDGANVRATIDGSGNVGIGTTAINSVLCIGTGTSSSPTYPGFIRLKGHGTQTADSTGGIEYLSAASGAGYGWRTTALDLGYGNTPFIFQSRSDSAAWTERMRIDANGNVFVGGSTAATANSPVYASTTAKAWASWTGSTGTVTASFNVSSVTRSALGAYVVNFTSALADNKYAIAGSSEWATGVSGLAGMVFGGDSFKTATSCRVDTFIYPSQSKYDPLSACVVCFR